MKIFCVGRNYIAHAAELNNPTPEKPVIFMKPETALADNAEPISIPSFTLDLQHELEVVLFINKTGKNILVENAADYFNKWTVGIDFTARDLQNKLKEKCLPWELAKSFDGAAVVGDFVPIEEKGQPASFQLKKNGSIVQQGNTKDMLFSFNAIISFISSYFTLEAGDMIYTGTPAGVSKVLPGDKLTGFLNGKCLFDIQMIASSNAK